MDHLLRRLRRQSLLGESALTDGQLLEHFVDHQDGAAFEALVRRYGPMVWAVCLRVLGQVQDAEDCFQATFLVLVRKATTVRPCDLVGHWLYGVAYRTALKARSLNMRRRAKERAIPPVTAPADGLQELLPLLDEELNRLPEHLRIPVVLCELQGKSRKEVARTLHIPEGTVSSRLATARKRLAQRLARRGVILPATGLMALTGNAASAGLSRTLVTSTVKVGMLLATEKAITGTVSVQVVALTEGVLKTMLLTKLRVGLALLVVTLIGSGTTWLWRSSLAAQPSAEQSEQPQERANRTPRVTIGSGLYEGWRRTLASSEPGMLGDQYVVWVENGWLQVQRRTRSGQTDWHIVLARATDPTVPTITVTKGTGNFAISYRDGRYFLRETANILRCVREPKRGEAGTWPVRQFLDESYSAGTAAAGTTVAAGWANQHWFVATCGPRQNRLDALIRLVPFAEGERGFGSQAFKDSLTRLECDKAWLLNDGELLVASRVLEADKEKQTQFERQKREQEPAATAAGDSAWGDLRGRFTYTGAPPQPSLLQPIGRDAPHFKKFQISDESLVVAKDGGLANAVVYVRSPQLPVHSLYEGTAQDRVPLTVKEGRLTPHVLTMRSSQTLALKNAEPVAVNIHLGGFYGFNVLFPAGGPSAIRRLRNLAAPAPIKSDLHPWMASYVLCRDNPYMAVSALDGTFSIEKLPVGEWEFQVWHERGGFLDTKDCPNGRFRRTIKPGKNDLGTIKLEPGMFDKGATPPRPADPL